jgi:lipopolysaccharide biosynthesis regulator YciM
MRAVPERSYLALPRLARLYAASGEPSRFVALCERLISASPRDWRARLALARQLRAEGKAEEAYGLLLRAMNANPQVLLVHLEMWRTLRTLGLPADQVAEYVAAAADAVFYAAPHVCTSCRYRAEDVLWRCPQCHQWNTFVEERLGPASGTS